MKKRIMILLLVGVILLTSGCGNSNYIVDKDNNIVKYAQTGQMLQRDILLFRFQNQWVFCYRLAFL